jgi:HMG-box domain
MSTISAVLYANQNHPELKIEYPQWSDRYKQIMKKWRALSSDKKAPYLQRARDNRSAQQAQLRTKKAQQVSTIVSFNTNMPELRHKWIFCEFKLSLFGGCYFTTIAVFFVIIYY